MNDLAAAICSRFSVEIGFAGRAKPSNLYHGAVVVHDLCFLNAKQPSLPPVTACNRTLLYVLPCDLVFGSMVVPLVNVLPVNPPKTWKYTERNLILSPSQDLAAMLCVLALVIRTSNVWSCASIEQSVNKEPTQPCGEGHVKKKVSLQDHDIHRGYNICCWE